MPTIVFVGQIGWLVANTKTKRKKGPQNVKNENFEKRKKQLFSHSPKEHIFTKLGYWAENCDLQLDHIHTDIQTPK